MIDLKWHTRFLSLAKEVSTWSKDPSTQVGAVAVNPETRQVLSMGYNGFPIGIDDTQERLINREVKYAYTVHAEMNAIYNATKLGISLQDAYLYVWPLPICGGCSLGVVQSGIKTVVLPHSALEKDEKWVKSWEWSSKVFSEAGVKVIWIGTEHLL